MNSRFHWNSVYLSFERSKRIPYCRLAQLIPSRHMSDGQFFLTVLKRQPCKHLGRQFAVAEYPLSDRESRSLSSAGRRVETKRRRDMIVHVGLRRIIYKRRYTGGGVVQIGLDPLQRLAREMR